MRYFTECVGVAVMDADKVLLGMRSDGQGLSMAGGKVDVCDFTWGTTPYETAAKRELFEEFSLRAERLQGYGRYISPVRAKGELCIASTIMYVCDAWEGTPTPKKDEMLYLSWVDMYEIFNNEHLFNSIYLPSREFLTYLWFSREV